MIAEARRLLTAHVLLRRLHLFRFCTDLDGDALEQTQLMNRAKDKFRKNDTDLDEQNRNI